MRVVWHKAGRSVIDLNRMMILYGRDTVKDLRIKNGKLYEGSVDYTGRMMYIPLSEPFQEEYRHYLAEKELLL